jgi:hypothetical protein
MAIIVAASVIATELVSCTSGTQRHPTPSQTKVLVEVAVVACIDTSCFELPVPDAVVDVTDGGSRQLAHGMTDDTGRATLPVSYAGHIAVSVTSVVLKDGRASSEGSVVEGETTTVQVAVPISDKVRPGA